MNRSFAQIAADDKVEKVMSKAPGLQPYQAGQFTAVYGRERVVPDTDYYNDNKIAREAWLKGWDSVKGEVK